MSRPMQNPIFWAVFLIFIILPGYLLQVIVVTAGSIQMYGDYTSFYIAGKMITQQKYAEIYNINNLITQVIAYYPVGLPSIKSMTFLYPPIFYPYVQFISFFTPFVGFCVWMGAQIILTICALWYCLARKKWLHFWRYAALFLLFSAPHQTFIIGQNGLLTGSLLMLGLHYAPTAPWLGGVLLSLVLIKPQFAALLVPFLLVRRFYKTTAVFFGAAAAQVVVSVYLYGLTPWHLFMQSSHKMMNDYLPNLTKFFNIDMFLSIYGLLRRGEWTHSTALYVQYLWSAVVLLLVIIMARRVKNYQQACALLLGGMMLFPPYILNYDAIFVAWCVLLWGSTFEQRVLLQQNNIILLVPIMFSGFYFINNGMNGVIFLSFMVLWIILLRRALANNAVKC